MTLRTDFREQFKEMAKHYMPEPRQTYLYPTSVIIGLLSTVSPTQCSLTALGYEGHGDNTQDRWVSNFMVVLW
jgi:hypothetical protein